MSRPSTYARWGRLAAGYLLAVAALGFAAQALGVGLRQLLRTPFQAGMGSLGAALALLFAHTLVNREAFVLLSRANDCGIETSALRRLWARSLLAKYVPGGVWQLVGRAMHMCQLGCTTRQAWQIGLIEQAASLCLCISISAAAWLMLEGHRSGSALVVTTTLAILFYAPRLLPSVADRKQATVALLSYAAAMPLYLAAYAFLVELPLASLATYLFAGTSAGMLAIIVPSGFGVREAVASLMAGSSGGQLLAAMVVARVATLAVETLLAVAGWLRPLTTRGL